LRARSEDIDWHGAGEPPKDRDAQQRSVLEALADWDEEGRPGGQLRLRSDGVWVPAAGSDSLSLEERIGWRPQYRPLLVGLMMELVDRGWVQAEAIKSLDKGGTYDFLVGRVTSDGRDFLIAPPYGLLTPASVVNIGAFHGQFNLHSAVQNAHTSIGDIQAGGADNQLLQDALRRLVAALQQDTSLNDEQRKDGLDTVSDLAEAFAAPPEGRRLSRIKGAVTTLGELARIGTAVADAWDSLHPLVERLLRGG
jgi:hypothetical protein